MLKIAFVTSARADGALELDLRRRGTCRRAARRGCRRGTATPAAAGQRRSLPSDSSGCIGARGEHDPEQEQHDHRADVDEHLHPGDELLAEQDELRGAARQHHHEDTARRARRSSSSRRRSPTIAIAAAMTPKKTFSATITPFPDSNWRDLGMHTVPYSRRFADGGHFLTSAPISRGSGSGTVVHPLAELVLVVEQLGDARLGVLELGAPERARRTGTPRRRCRSTCTARSRCRSGRARSRCGDGRPHDAAAAAPCGPRCRCTSRGTAARTACTPCSSLP